MGHGKFEPLASQFGQLLHGYGAALSRCHPRAGARTECFRGLLEGFVEADQRASQAEAANAAEDHREFGELLDGFERAIAAWRDAQKATADDFNLLSVLKVAGDELRHSRVLAWLLDHDLLRLGTHAQGNLGFRLFLEELALPREYANGGYRVHREVAGDESRVDLEVAARGRFLLWIENKIWSAEGEAQTHREWDDLQRRAAQLGVPADRVHALFLTLGGSPPQNPGFVAVRWRTIASVFDRFAVEAHPDDVKLFCRHYARALREMSSEPPGMQETKNDQGEAVVQRGRALPDPELADGVPHGGGNAGCAQEVRGRLRQGS
ncbi:MAG TPA: PD-(D/E)XK nuclease family protein [Planctomycetota bacterium]|nr:PD-(D/E)XK nuclease family protein [Planctomycetota bacterium]HRR81218.1 PD-(D/E)XK nuclease family protein [Planctomycetota bacterium]HRT93551.1 PD-(D/E)XK nuclease family protein [Planctomycetota bacterium]